MLLHNIVAKKKIVLFTNLMMINTWNLTRLYLLKLFLFKNQKKKQKTKQKALDT